MACFITRIGSYLKNALHRRTESLVWICVMASEQPTKLRILPGRITTARLLGLAWVLVVSHVSYGVASPNRDCGLGSPNNRAASFRISRAHSTSRLVGSAQENTAPKQKQPAGTLTIIPKIVVLSKPPFWATSTDTVVMKISLEALRGSQRVIYKRHPKISLILRPANAAFSSSRVDIPDGSDESDPFTLTSSVAQPIEVTCAPDNDYSGPLIAQAEPAKITFLAPINKIGIEPVFHECDINVGATFKVFLYNQADKEKVALAPIAPVLIQLSSQSENGTLEKTQVELTTQEFSQNIRYVGTKLGYDTITALGHYQTRELTGASDRRILFPWLTFIAGLVGTLIGAILRAKMGAQTERRKNFIESSIWGLAWCTILILYPIGTNLPQITTYLQPALGFVLALVLSFFGPKVFNYGLSFIK
jgi:hypothetical protein